MEVRKRLTKYTSVAQKYAQEKALKEGRSADSKVRPTEELVLKELWQYLDRFDKERAKRLPKPSKWDMKIEFIEGSVLPKPGPVYSLSPQERQAVEEFIDENLEKGWIRAVGNDLPPEQKSSVASPVFFVGKKDAGARLVIDYREINKICRPDPYPIPLLHALPDNLATATWFTTLDLRSGYNNIRIHPGHEKFAAFRTHKGVYQPLVMQFGMMNSPAVFQRAMNQLFEDLLQEGVLIYLDDIIIYAENQERLWELTREVLRRLREADFI